MLNNNSLVLTKNQEIIKSTKKGVRPLFDIVKKYKNKISGCVLYDKVVGLAAARLIVYSGFIIEVHTPVVSKKAKKLLEQNQIKINYEEIVENILRKDSQGVCPMETKAHNITNKEFYFELNKLFNTKE